VNLRNLQRRLQSLWRNK